MKGTLGQTLAERFVRGREGDGCWIFLQECKVRVRASRKGFYQLGQP